MDFRYFVFIAVGITVLFLPVTVFASTDMDSVVRSTQITGIALAVISFGAVMVASAYHILYEGRSSILKEISKEEELIATNVFISSAPGSAKLKDDSNELIISDINAKIDEINEDEKSLAVALKRLGVLYDVQRLKLKKRLKRLTGVYLRKTARLERHRSRIDRRLYKYHSRCTRMEGFVPSTWLGILLRRLCIWLLALLNSCRMHHLPALFTGLNNAYRGAATDRAAGFSEAFSEARKSNDLFYSTKIAALKTRHIEKRKSATQELEKDFEARRKGISRNAELRIKKQRAQVWKKLKFLVPNGLGKTYRVLVNQRHAQRKALSLRRHERLQNSLLLYPSSSTLSILICGVFLVLGFCLNWQFLPKYFDMGLITNNETFSSIGMLFIVVSLTLAEVVGPFIITSSMKNTSAIRGASILKVGGGFLIVSGVSMLLIISRLQSEIGGGDTGGFLN